MYSQPLKVIITVIIIVALFSAVDTGRTEDNNLPPPLKPLPQVEVKSGVISVFPPPMTRGSEHVLSEIEGGGG